MKSLNLLAFVQDQNHIRASCIPGIPSISTDVASSIDTLYMTMLHFHYPLFHLSCTSVKIIAMSRKLSSVRTLINAAIPMAMRGPAFLLIRHKGQS